MADRDPAAPGLRVERVRPDQWRAYRAVRQASLIDSPRAFWTTFAESAERSDDDWRTFVVSGPTVWLGWEGDRPVGTVALWHADEQPDDEVYLVGMWVAGAARGTGAAAALVGAALDHAREQGWGRVVLDVAVENVRAAAFYRRMGFVPTGETGTMPWDPSCVEERLVRPLGS